MEERNDFQLYSGDHVIVSEVNLNEMENVAGLHFITNEASIKKR
jgi:hypothetical protein